MKRVQVRPGKFVSVSSKLAEKAALAMSTAAFSRTQIDQIAKTEKLVRVRGGVLLGGLKPAKSAKKIA
jgi:hypothetical protein